MENTKILLLEGIDKSAEETFRESGYKNVVTLPAALTGDQLIEEISDANIVGIRSRTKLTHEVLEHAKELYAIGCFCIGTDQVALSDAALHGVPVFNAPHSNTRSVAELVIGYAVMLMRNIFPKSMAAHDGKWLKDASGSHEVRGKVIGIVGYGHIGSQVSILAESIGMQVCYYDTQTKLPLGNAQPVSSLEELLEKSHIVTLHVPGDESTINIMDLNNLLKMKRGAFLINASRGTTVDIEALKSCLDDGRIQGAAIDVFPQEPKNSDKTFESPLRGYSNVILTPHIGGATTEAQRNIGVEVSNKLIKYTDRGNTEGAVNFPMINLPIHRDTHRVLHIHKNIPGMLQQINKAVADEGINVQSQYLLTNPDIGYVVLDIEKTASKSLHEALDKIEGTIRTRIIF